MNLDQALTELARSNAAKLQVQAELQAAHEELIRERQAKSAQPMDVEILVGEVAKVSAELDEARQIAAQWKEDHDRGLAAIEALQKELSAAQSRIEELEKDAEASSLKSRRKSFRSKSRDS